MCVCVCVGVGRETRGGRVSVAIVNTRRELGRHVVTSPAFSSASTASNRSATQSLTHRDAY